MTRLFFDLHGPKARCYDFRGDTFQNIEDARVTAEMLSLDVGCSDDSGQWQGAEVQVRNVRGELVLSIAVPTPDASAT